MKTLRRIAWIVPLLAACGTGSSEAQAQAAPAPPAGKPAAPAAAAPATPATPSTPAEQAAPAQPAAPAKPAEPAHGAAGVTAIPLPGGEGGIGFDDLRYSKRLGRVLVPGGRTGKLFLVDPATLAVQSVDGFSAKASFSGGHGDGTTSVDEADGVLVAIDRTSRALLVLDGKLAVASQVALGGGPDYVRWVAPTREVWVTEPGEEQVEVFKLGATPHDPPERIAVIAVPGGPESLVVDAARHCAWTHLWKGKTVSIDLHSRAVGAPIRNSCEGSRGIALDESRGLLLVGCAEGRQSVLDLAQGGALQSSADVGGGGGVDIIDYDPAIGHLYAPAGESGKLAVLGVGDGGSLAVLGLVPMAPGCHSVVTDGAGRVFVGDPDGGRLLVYRDSFPSSLPATR